MKTQQKIICIALWSALSVTAAFSGEEEISIPLIAKPAMLEEGTQRELTLAQINELLPWAKDSKIFLSDLLDNIESLSMSDKVERLVEGISSVVEQSSSKHSELLMRYSLNRGLVINEILSRESDADAVGTIDAKYRVLKSSILMAIKYYETDMAILAKKSVAPYVLFGLDYFNFLTELNKSIFDASAQYQVQRTSLEWLQWDLYRDLNNSSYAPQIVKINNGLKTFPNRKLTDAQSISHIRQMKGLAKQLNLTATLRKLESDRELAMAKTEEQRVAIIKQRQLDIARQAQLEEERRIDQEMRDLNDGKEVKQARLAAGETVLLRNQVRTVEYVTDKNQVVLTYVYNKFNQDVVNRNDVQKAYTSNLGLKQNDTVFFGNTIRTVEYIGERGRVTLNYVYNRFNQDFTDIKSVSKTISSYKHLNVGDKVLYNGKIRDIEYLDMNGRIVLTYVYNKFNQDFTTVDSVSKAY